MRNYVHIIYQNDETEIQGGFLNWKPRFFCNCRKIINAITLAPRPAYYYRSTLYCVSIAILYVHFLPIKQFR